MAKANSTRGELRFSELADINPRRGLKRGERYPYVEMAAVPEGGGQLTHHEFRNFAGGGSKFQAGDTLFARITPCTENGKLAYVERLPEKSLGFGSTELIVLAAREGISHPRFIYHLAAWDKVRRHAVARMFGTSGRQRVPTWFFTEELTVPKFPLAEQRAIAAVLDSIDNAIERTEEVIAATERLRDALLHDLLTRGLPGRHTKWKEVRGLGTIPATWDVVRLGAMCEPPEYGAVASARPYDPDLPRYVRITDLTEDGRLKDEELRSADPSAVEGYELYPGDMLFARSGATVGKTYMYRTDDGPCVYAGYLIRFTPKQAALSPEFLEAWTHSDPYLRWVQSMMRAGAQPNINATEYASLRIPLPPLNEQQEIAAVIHSIDQTIDRNAENRDTLEAAKASTADALLSGRVRAGQETENSVLLRRAD